MTIEGELVEILLRNKEVAYLVPVGFDDRGRNFMKHIVMIRPGLKEVREVDAPVAQGIDVHDLNHDGISEVVAFSVASGQGTLSGINLIMQFDGWTPIVLHEAEFFEGCNYSEAEPICSSSSTAWEFVDLDSDGSADLIEKMTVVADSPEDQPAAPSEELHRYLFKENGFIKQ